MSASVYAPSMPPICAMCLHGWNDGGREVCTCPLLVARHGVQPMRWMRSLDDGCPQADHRLLPLSFVEH